MIIRLIYGVGVLLLFVIFPKFSMSLVSIVGLIAIGLGIVVGAYIVFSNYISSIIENINPYDYYEDNSPHKQKFAARRNYFFGPGYAQLSKVIDDAWNYIWTSIDTLFNIPTDLAEAIDFPVIKQVLWLECWLFAVCAAVTICVFVCLITFLLGVTFATVLTIVMAVILVLFSAIWLIDRVYLQCKSIRTNCPVDHTRAVIPMFECPGCGNTHDKLVPGPYGIWHRECTCGTILPTTFFLGRSKLKALCPLCGTELAASDTQQISFSLVGGTSSGKTMLLTAFYHEFFSKLDKNGSVSYEIPKIHEAMFENLSDWYSGVPCPATVVSHTSEMYSIILKSDLFDVAKQFSIYDIAGESFEDPTMANMLPQKQMRDSDGVIITIDPLSAMAMRESAQSLGDDTRNYSTTEAATIISNFATYLKAVLTNSSIKTKSQKPVSVVITKADLSSVSRRISYHKIKIIMKQQPDAFRNFDEARDTICREFLLDIGLMGAVQAIEAGFADVHYFPVSAMGHAENGEEYEPEHVIEPFSWLIERAQPELMQAMDLSKM